MRNFRTLILLLTMTFVTNGLFSQTSPSKKIKTLIVDGQNNHDEWPKITYMLKTDMENTGLFTVEVARSAFTWKGDKFISEFPIANLPKTEAKEEPQAESKL
ncbi:hypothetical protein ACU8V7_11195 [Zobellia nedashkovskayae]